MVSIHDELGKVEDVFAISSDVALPLMKAAHKLIISIDPDAVIVPRVGERSICYGVGPKKMSESYCYLIPNKNHINLGFFYGTTIDAKKELEGTGAIMRHLKIHSLEDLSKPRVSRLIRLALGERKKSLGR